MSAISTTGARIDRWDNGRPAHREHARLVEALKLERSSRYLYWAAFITFISERHDEDAPLILAPYRSVGPTLSLPAPSPLASGPLRRPRSRQRCPPVRPPRLSPSDSPRACQPPARGVRPSDRLPRALRLR